MHAPSTSTAKLFATPEQDGRRQFLNRLLTLPLTAVLFATPAKRAEAAEGVAPTPADDYGPFYPPSWAGEVDTDLTRFGKFRAEGQRLRLSGVVRDHRGQPVGEAVVEIWQTDARGRYRHPGVPEHLRDPGFQGYGRTTTGTDGAYAFTTVVPGRYGSRPPHIHVRVARPSRPEFVTQLYFRGQNAEGGVAAGGGAVPPGREERSLDLMPAGAIGGLAARFDLVLPP